MCVLRTAIVVYQLFYRMVLGWSFNWGDLIKFLSQATLGAYVLCFQQTVRPAPHSLFSPFVVQCRHWPCFWNCVCPVAGIYIQWHNYWNYSDLCCELYCLLHCMYSFNPLQFNRVLYGWFCCIASVSNFMQYWKNCDVVLRFLEILCTWT